MAYSTIDKSTAHFNTITYSNAGDGAKAVTGVGFQPDLVWVKNRTVAYHPQFHDALRGASNGSLYTSTNNAVDSGYPFSSFNSDGFTTGSQSSNESQNSANQVAWNWLAGGASPSQTYVVKVVSDSGNKYRFDDFGSSAVTLDLQEGGTYTFDQSDSSNSGHPLRFSTTSNGSHGGGSEYTTGVTTNGTPGSSGAYTRITVAASAPTLYYYCTSHSGMGGQANTNSTFGSSNFSGSIQSTVSVNTTAGFSIVKWTGTTNKTVGHGLGVKPDMVITKSTTSSTNWASWHKDLTGGDEEDRYVNFNTDAADDNYTNYWGTGGFTSSVFGVSNNAFHNNSGTMIAYCFASKTGYSKFGSYTANANADGPFIYTGFKPKFVITKRISATGNFVIQDNKRSTADGGNPNDKWLYSNDQAVEYDASSYPMDMLSNGFKIRHGNGSYQNEPNGAVYLYMAFGQTMVGSNNVPATAR